jgi:hypothetical protein
VDDTKIKKYMIDWLKEHDHSNISLDPTNQFDLISTGDGDLPRLLFEIEVNYAWQGEWPETWEEIFISEEKVKPLEKWREECPDDILTFVVFRSDLGEAWHIDGSSLLECTVRNNLLHIPTSDAYLMDMTYDESSR